jgi:phenylpropionate dioxygenase-like ring-hydroxylating dioxygenase large terminal subunit
VGQNNDAVATYPLNAWYAATWASELSRGLLSRRICNKQIVFYRSLAGRAVALEDACWHRLLPLSKGRLDGDDVVCGYHGLAFNPQGRCTFMPSQKSINPSACIRSYPVVERHKLIWIWMGDVAQADEAKIPDLHWNDDAAWTSATGNTIHGKCNYRLVIDNLMDLTHETFVHGSSLGHKAVAEAPFEVTHGNRMATVTRWMRDIYPPPHWAMQYEYKFGKVDRVDRWQIIRFEAPATVVIDVGVAKAGSGAPEGNRDLGVNGHVLNTITPETETTCHYFWAFARNYGLQDPQMTERLREDVVRVFREDEVILEAQQIAILESPSTPFYNLNIDAGAMWARRMIDEMILDERPRNQRPKLAV